MTEVIEKTEYKKGYKKTKLGWIPEDWKILQLKDICPLQRGFDLPSSDVVLGKYPIVYSNGIQAYHKEFKVKAPGVITGRSGTIGKVHFIEKDFWPHNTTLWVTDFKNNNPKYIYYLLISLNLGLYHAGSGVPTLNRNYIHIKYHQIPPIQEQEKIAEILSAWDDGIETLEKLIEQKEILKKATMQKLFFEKESWQMMRFDKIFKDFCKKNYPRERLLSATQENGVIPRDMLSGKVMSPEGSLEGYKLIEVGDFVISLRSFQGGLEYSKYRGILSPAYTVLKNIIDIDKDFYRHFFKSYKFIEKYLSISVIGIRDGKQISYSDLSSVKIPYPPLEEQEKIGKILNCYDKEIKILNSKLEKLKEQKKGLMQKLLTGQIRVKV